MKNITLLLMGTIITIALSAQVENPFQSRQKSLLKATSIPKPTEVIDQDWVAPNWINEYRTVVSYNADNDYSQMNFQEWKNNDWQTNERTTYYYLSKGIEQYRIDEELNPDTHAWEIAARTDNTYENGKIKTVTRSETNEGVLYASERITYTYDSNNYLISMLIEYRDEDAGSDWEEYLKTTYSNHPDGRVQSSVVQFKMPAPIGWKYQYRDDYSYDGNKLLQIIHLKHDGTNWLDDSRNRYSYYPNGNEETDIEEKLENGNWVMERLITTWWNAKNEPTEMLYQDREANTWVNDFRTLFLYGTSTGSKAVEALRIRVFPNPTQDLINITTDDALNAAEIQIIDTQGRVITTQRHKGASSTIDVAGLSAGNYFVVLRQNNKVTVTKFTKK